MYSTCVESENNMLCMFSTDEQLNHNEHLKKKTCAYVRPEFLILRKDTTKLSSQTSSGFTAKHFPPNYFEPVSFLKGERGGNSGHELVLTKTGNY